MLQQTLGWKSQEAMHSLDRCSIIIIDLLCTQCPRKENLGFDWFVGVLWCDWSESHMETHSHIEKSIVEGYTGSIKSLLWEYCQGCSVLGHIRDATCTETLEAHILQEQVASLDAAHIPDSLPILCLCFGGPPTVSPHFCYVIVHLQLKQHISVHI